MTAKLPEPDRWVRGFSAEADVALYTAEQMQAAILAERERCAALCDAKSREWIACGPTENWEYRAHGAEDCAAAIRGDE